MLDAPNRRFRFSRIGMTCLLLTWGAIGCREEAPPEQPELQDVFGDDAGARTAGATLDAPPLPPERLVADDDNDEPGAPAFLPRSNTVNEWIKTRAVRLVDVWQFLEVLEDVDRGAEISPYRVRDVVTCAYQKDMGGLRLSLDVHVVRCESPADAFGLFTTQRTGHAVGPTAQVWSTEWKDGYLLHAWQGDCHLRVHAQPRDADNLITEAEKLIARILLALPKSDPPWLISLLPSSDRLGDRQWFARRCRSLAAPGARLLAPDQLDSLDNVLASSSARGIVVASYRTSDGEPPNTIWLVEYESRTDALKAFERYRRTVEGASARGASSTQIPFALLISPVGRFLAGSWSPQQESVMHVLPRLRATLSRVESSAPPTQ